MGSSSLNPASGFGAPVYRPQYASDSTADEFGERDTRSFGWMYAVLGVMLALACATGWWWSRGSDVRVVITPADAAVTFDGAQMAVTNGEIYLPAVKRGPHMLVVKPLAGGTLRHSVDVGFFESSQTVEVKPPSPVGARRPVQTSRLSMPN